MTREDADANLWEFIIPTTKHYPLIDSMSFLAAGVEEEMLTLEAALEFIDSCGDDSNLSSDALSDAQALTAVAAQGGSPTATSTSASSDDDTATSRAPPTNKSGVASTVSRKLCASTQQQRRRKQEIQSLREQAGELEAQLAQLKRIHSRWLGSSISEEQCEDSEPPAVGPQRPGPMIKKRKKTTSVWMDLAAIQFRERQRAELTNRKLKAIWGSQSKVNKALQQILQTRSTFAGWDLVFNQPALYDTPSSAYVGVNVMTELEKQMQSLYLESETVFRPAGDGVVSITCSTETQYEPGVGTFIDLRTTTPMACALELASKLVWEEANSKRKYPDKTYEIKRGSDANSSEKNFLWTLRDTDRKVQLNGLQYMRKFEEPNRVVIVRSTLLLLPTSGAKFRDRTWMVITPSPEDPVHKSLVRYCYRVYTEPEASASMSRADLDHLRRFVSNTLMNGMRMFAQMIQNAMLDFSSRQALLHHARSVSRVH